ncbi:7235_t:CDS:1, partial [Dentiscutata heterogama]
IEEIYKADKVIYFTKRLKRVTKAKINYWAPKILDDAVKLAASYDLAIYGVVKPVCNKFESSGWMNQRRSKITRQSLKPSVEQSPISIKLNRAKTRNNFKKTSLKRNKKKILTNE